MIFTPHHVRLILESRKTQTRRLYVQGDSLKQRFDIDLRSRRRVDVLPLTITNNGRIRWQVGKTYALQPGRGKSAVGRIRITAIRTEFLQDIGEQDAIAEGMAGWADYALVWDSINTRKGTRWADNPAVWVLTFEVVEGVEA